MPKPITTARVKELAELGEREVFTAYLEEGSVKALVHRLWEPAHEGAEVGPAALYEWLHADAERWDRQKVRALRGHIDADQAYDTAMSATEDDARSKKLQVDTLKWRAGVSNREHFGTQPSQQVTVNIGDQWLNAIKAAEEPETIPEAEVTVEPSAKTDHDRDPDS